MNEVEKHYAGPSREEPDEGVVAAASKSARQAGDMARRAAEGVRGGVTDAADWARERYGDAADYLSDRYESASRSAGEVRRRSAAEFSRSRDSVGRLVEENPIMVGVVGLAAGLLIGSLLPGTRRENRVFGRYADEVRDQGLRYAQGLAEEGRHVVEEQLGKLPQGRRDRDTGDETSER